MILDEIVADKKEQLQRDKKHISGGQMRKRAEACMLLEPAARESFYDSLSKSGLSIIGEFKNASPSLGNIDSSISLKHRIRAYNAAVDAVSCLTEEQHFHGNTAYFKQIRKMTALPMLRKDFMIEEYQFYEARAIGADAVLLIASILDDGRMRAFYQLARELKLDALVEVHDEQEMERALALDAKIIGINNRNLKDFTISLERTGKLAAMVPKEKILIAESGIMNKEDAAYLAEQQVDGFLVGRAFMEHANPVLLAEEWKTVYKEQQMKAGGRRNEYGN